MHFIRNGKVICGATHVRGKWTTIESHVTCEDCFEVLDSEEEDKVHLEDHTFGNAPVEVSLARILNEINNRRLASRAGNLISRYDAVVKTLCDVKNEKTKRYLADVSRKDMYSLVDDLDTSEKVKTHIKNALTIRHRKVYNVSRRFRNEQEKEKVE